MTVVHGVTTTETSSTPVAMSASQTNVIGLIAWAPDADPIAFPQDTPVLVTSITRALTGAGYGGTLRRALEAIQPITNPTMVVIRCASGSVSDVIGTTTNGVRTGMQALLTAKSVLGVVPKITIAPQLESPDVDQAMIAIDKKVRGYYYSTPRTQATGDGVDPNQRTMLSSMTDVAAYADSLGDREIELIWPEFTSGNVLQPLAATPPGAYRIVSTQAILPSSGDALPLVYSFPNFYIAATGTLGQSSGQKSPAGWAGDTSFSGSTPQGVVDSINGVIGSNGVLARLIANDFIEIVSASEFFYDANDYDGGPLGASFTPLGEAPFSDTAVSPVPEPTPVYGPGNLPTTAVAAALRAQIDIDVGFQKSLSNVVVNGPTGISQPITWDLEDQDTDAAYLNNHNVTTLIQHEGFRFWGNRNCSSDPNFVFEVYTRTAQFMLDTIVANVFPFLDQPLTGMLAKDIIDEINAFLRTLVKGTPQKLIGGFCWYDPDNNSAEQLAAGQFVVSYNYTPVPTLENLGLNQQITDTYLVNFAQLISGQSS